ncbi:hypothetical protein [Bradyrhizobium sp. WSM1253]|uniref:hypothetical protein n=1 Tax=Bradyrhizobium sp. WSM1253 TaxID=319003 RepID=UPI00025D0D4C|nr:hypothetical protein [Bradyrhizobium sp. WSM1253]EIG63528.1 hypothetical protein Bra1253DRAFT_00006 [Bradyrhizobium sp. WSM1253]
MTDIAHPATKPYHFLAREEEQRLISRWRLGLIAFYGSLLALLIAFAAMTSASRVPQADRASGDVVTHDVSNPPVP